MSSLIRCAAACGRELEAEDTIEIGGVLVCQPCHEAIAKQAEQRDSIDDALRALRSVSRDGALFIDLTIPPIGPIEIDVRFMRVHELTPAATVNAHGGTDTIAKVLRQLAIVIDNLPAPLPAGGT